MSRLLLVDDNPSIHRIAESLLAATDVEITCVDSAAEALDRISQGERWDVALVDTAMPGMDGWTLLSRLRAMEETALMPIALMAGVLDPVDPAKLAKAPIQGFLKKPIELRELGDRVKALLNTPVVNESAAPESSPAQTTGSFRNQSEVALPEYRHETPDPVESLPEAQEDLLLLDASDLWSEEAPSDPTEPQAAEADPEPPAVLTLSDMHLELEELDLDSLQDLTGTLSPLEPAEEAPLPEVDLAAEAEQSVAEEPILDVVELDELDTYPTESEVLPEPWAEPVPEPLAAELPAVDEPLPASSLDAPVLTEAVASGAAEAGSQDQVQALVQALLADPALVDALAKAVVARMGDQILREIAWEVMPDLAGRLQR